ncbi:MAG: ethanolamine ammonia-lyase subunit EutB [Acutalibacteraceae bacterium]
MDIREIMAKANDKKSGDTLAGIAAENALERVRAREKLASLTVHDLFEHPAVPYEEDAVTRIIIDDVDQEEYRKIQNWTIGDLREWLLDDATTGDRMLAAGRGMSSEVIAGVCKLMGNLDLMLASSKMHIEKTCNTTIGGPNVLASRLQPNHPVDSPKGVTASTLEGLSYGVGDAVLGLNPAIDTVESTVSIWNILNGIRDRYEVPTQTCVLSHVTTQMKALQTGAKADLCFQSLAGTEDALAAFGVTTDMLSEARQMFLEDGSAKGPNVMYFETGQGSELSSSAHHGWDQVTMECRCYGLARHYDPFLVNTVVGFMGPEYLYDAHQLLRAGLEDVFNGHLHGLPMGCDVCYTNHMPTDQNDGENLAVMLTAAGCHYFMGLPQGDDIMLMYQSTGYHDIAALRTMMKRRPIPEFEAWLEKRGIWEDGHLGPAAGDPTRFLEEV